MKRVQRKGVGTKKRQAEPLTEKELWKTGQLGDHSPQALVDMMLFMNCLMEWKWTLLYKLYQSKCPPNSPKNEFVWDHYKYPMLLVFGKLDGNLARMCKAVGIGGFKTNHSLHATAATQLYQAEQLIMETTGHQSLDGVCNCKRTSVEQQQVVSDILL